MTGQASIDVMEFGEGGNTGQEYKTNLEVISVAPFTNTAVECHKQKKQDFFEHEPRVLLIVFLYSPPYLIVHLALTYVYGGSKVKIKYINSSF
ncbi:hypothetical protein EYC84_005600 [Monilinia fructicola]|uniref:Uncharacterized protein n=1 Tax=Monilinia fructicola TaxID=38448 RepID=A0A5M9K1R4_MONFR|nr:hypothetical protein EYC84_005600 [Monilinia fructicola]